MDNTITLLLVDDEPAHSVLVKRNLLKMGLSNAFVLLTSGQQVIDFINAQGEFGNRAVLEKVFILLDINMPGITGIEVLKILKQDPTRQHIPIIMLTTSDDPSEINECFRLGCNAYFVKPVEHQQFVEKIQELGKFLTLTQIPNFSL